MRYFTAILEHGSFSKASARLNVAQPALSHHVRNMEDELGTALLVRSARGVVPTEAGLALQRHANLIIDQLSVATDEIRGIDHEPVGEVRIGLPGTISEILAVPLIIAARERWPKVKLQIAEAMSGFVLEWLRDGRIDLAVTYQAFNEDGLETIRLLQEELVFFGAKSATTRRSDATVTLAEITESPLILPSEAHGLRRLLEEEAKSARIALRVAMDVDAYRNIKELVAAGIGFSILPLHALQRDLVAGRLQYWHLREPPLTRGAHLAFSVDRPLMRATSAVRDLITVVVRDLVEQGIWAGARLALNE